MVLLTLDQITKSYTEKKLLNQISFTLNEGDKVGVIGINGTGKSTLLKIVAGIEQPDQGKVVKSNSVRIGYLPQNPVFTPGNTVLEQVLDGISNQLDTKEYEAKAMLQKLGIADDTQLVDELSGGQKKRVAIAAALLHPCEVLVMDEPTNHLDHKMVTWLEEYLKKYRGALLMVTHDRYFLDRVTNQILEIDRGAIYQYETNYSGFVATKAIAITVGTKYREILSAIRAIGAFLPCASSTIRMIFASVVSSSTALHSITILASSAIVPWINASPCCLETGILSPVSMLSSTLACPSFKIPSTGICSPGFTTSRSPIVISSA